MAANDANLEANRINLKPYKCLYEMASFAWRNVMVLNRKKGNRELKCFLKSVYFHAFFKNDG